MIANPSPSYPYLHPADPNPGLLIHTYTQLIPTPGLLIHTYTQLIPTPGLLIHTYTQLIPTPRPSYPYQIHYDIPTDEDLYKDEYEQRAL